MTPLHLVAVTEWLTWVAHGTGMPGGNADDAKIKTMAVMLGGKYPDTRMFTTASASFVALECGLMKLPSVALLGGLLERWWGKNKPAQPALAAPGVSELADAPLSGGDRMAVKVWLERDADGSLSQHEMAMRLAVVRRFNESGFRWLIGHNTRAEAIAESSGWVPRDTAADDYTDPGRILASVRNIVDPPHPNAGFFLGLLRRNVERAAPHLAELVPLDLADIEASGPERRPTPKQAADIRADDGVVSVKRTVDNAPAPRKPHGQLTPEQTLALRMSDPLLRQVVERQAAAKARLEQIRRDFDPDPDPEDIPWDTIGAE